MKPRLLELALKKQRLQFRSAEQRRQLVESTAVLMPVFSAAEYCRSGIRWVRDHPAVTVGALIALLVAKPRMALRWGRRAWLVWLAWRKWGRQHGDAEDASVKVRLRNHLNNKI